MILIFILLLVIVPAFLISLGLMPIIIKAIQLDTERMNNIDRELEDNSFPQPYESPMMMCPKCDSVREGVKCSKCGTDLISIDEYEETW